MTPKRICVRFAGDNDFINVVQPFTLQLGYKVYVTKEWADITKTQIVELFNITSWAYYLMYQTREAYFNDSRNYKQYLQIDTKCVLFDDEIDKFQDSGQWNGDGCVVYMRDDVLCHYII